MKTTAATKKKRKGINRKSKQPLHKERWISFFVIGVLFLGTILFLSQSQKPQHTTSNAASNCTLTAADLQMKPIEKQFLDQINAYRKTKGAGALVWSNDLKKPAQWLSNDMSAKKYLQHTDSLGRAPDARYTACGVTNTNWEENILEGATSAADALKIWQSDVPHDSNMTNPKMKQIGIGSTNGYWTTDFSGDTPTGNSSNPIVGSSSATVSPSPVTSPIPSASPSAATVPNPNCLGSCPTTGTSGASLSVAPSVIAVSPTVSVPTNIGTGGNGIMQIILLLLTALLGLFKGI
ncbi:MAG: CAP domain-containing protein [Candidatus Levyibacteriota bacterium]